MLIKNFLDHIFSIFSILLLAPLLIIILIIIRITNPLNPAIFKQKRLGKNSKPFTIYKFRTMNVGAEKQQQRLFTAQGKYRPNHLYDTKNDHRITKIGKFLRKTHLDELPQLFNIAKGEMSFVGPRPVLLEETDLIDQNTLKKILAIKPGLTGSWQISKFVNTKKIQDKTLIDINYIENLSLVVDFQIILKTFGLFFKLIPEIISDLCRVNR